VTGPDGVASPRGDWRDFSEPAIPALLQSALEQFVTHGYHGTSVRTLAAGVGMSVAGLYHHYPSKQATLVAIIESAMADLYTRTLGALAEAGDSVDERLTLHIQCLVLFHAYRADLAFVAASEIRSLEPAARERVIGQRDRQQGVLDGIIEDGVRGGRFRTAYPHDASRAIVTMCTGVAQWFRLGGPLAPEELAERYVTMAKALLDPAI